MRIMDIAYHRDARENVYDGEQLVLALLFCTRSKKGRDSEDQKFIQKYMDDPNLD